MGLQILMGVKEENCFDDEWRVILIEKLNGLELVVW